MGQQTQLVSLWIVLEAFPYRVGLQKHKLSCFSDYLRVNVLLKELELRLGSTDRRPPDGATKQEWR